jgi:hypothetical protein
MANICFNPNLPPNDAPSEDLVVAKLGGLILGDPEAFDPPTLEPNVGGSWNAEAWNSIFDEVDEVED